MRVTSATGNGPSAACRRQRGRLGRVDGPAGLDRADVRDPELGHRLLQRGEHRSGWIECDHLPHDLRERQGIPAGARSDVEDDVIRPHEAAQRIEHRIVDSARIRPEERADGSVEIGVLGRLPDPLDLLPVGSHPVRPRGFDEPREVSGRVDIGVHALDRYHEDELRMRLDERPEPSITPRLADQSEGRSGDEHRVRAASPE